MQSMPSIEWGNVLLGMRFAGATDFSMGERSEILGRSIRDCLGDISLTTDPCDFEHGEQSKKGGLSKQEDNFVD